jgi:hypothetical protein
MHGQQNIIFLGFFPWPETLSYFSQVKYYSAFHAQHLGNMHAWWETAINSHILYAIQDRKPEGDSRKINVIHCNLDAPIASVSLRITSRQSFH